MQLLVGYARSCFWTLGVVTVLSGLFCVFIVASTHASRPYGAAIGIAICLLAFAIGAFYCLAARAWRRKSRFARPLVAIGSVFSLILFPFGTVAGAVGLYWCFSKRTRELEPLVESFDHQPKPGDGTQAWIQKVVSVVSVVIWLASLNAAAWWGLAHGLPSRGAVNGLGLLIIGELISVLCHELGHAVAGWGAGMSLCSFIVGPFIARREAGRWKMQFSPASMLSVGGSVASSPLHLNNLRKRMAFEVAGGPVASFFTAAIAFLVLLLMPGSAWEAWWKVPAVIAAISAGAAVLNSIPFGFAAGYSDGALLVQLLRGGPFADLREAMKMVAATTVTSTRPRDLDPFVLAHGMRAGVGTPHEGILQMIQLACALDRGDLTAAREHLESSLLRIPAPDKAPSVGRAVEMAFYMAYLDGSANRAGVWLQAVENLAVAKKQSLTANFDYWLALSAVRDAEGLSQLAEEAWQRAFQLSAQKPSFGLYQFERDLLQTVRKREWLRPSKSELIEASV